MAGGVEISPFYDSLVAKLIAYGDSFDQARRRALVALDEFAIVGVESTIPFHKEALNDAAFCAGDFDTGFIEERMIIPKVRGSASAAKTTDEKFAVAAFLLSRDQFPSEQGEAALSGPGGAVAPSRRIGLQGRGRFVDAL